MSTDIQPEASKNMTMRLKKQWEQLRMAEKINYLFYDISHGVNQTYNLEELYRHIHISLGKVIELPNFFVCLYDAERNIIDFEYFVDEQDVDVSRIEHIGEPSSLSGAVIKEKRPLFLKENMLLEKARKNQIVGTVPKVWIGVPLITQGKVIGVVSTQHYTDPDYFSHKHLELFVCAAEQIAIAIERKRLLRAIEKKDRQLSFITANTRSIILIFNIHGHYDFVNPAFEQLGHRADDPEKPAVFDLLHPEDVEPLMLFIKKGLDGGTSQMPMTFRLKDRNGDYRRIEGVFQLVKNPFGPIEKIALIGEDVSEKTRVQTDLNESEKRFRHIFDASPDAMMITNLKTGTIINANRAFFKTFGLGKEEVIGKTTRELGLWADDTERDAGISELEKSGTYNNFEAELSLNNRKVSALISACRIELEGTDCIISIAKDISEKKKEEAQLLQRQKMESIGTLAGGIAHEFNNLLSGIMGHLELLNLDPENLEDVQKDHIENALISTKRAAKVTRQLQALTRADTAEPERIDLHRLAADVFKILDRTAPSVEKRLEIEKDRFYTNGYEAELYQVLMNLGLNAIQAIEKKGRPKDRFIRIYAPEEMSGKSDEFEAPGAAYLHLCFEDNGCGMTEDAAQKAFDPLFSTQKKQDGKGQGLGLAMVYYTITKRHLGSIKFETREGEGTTFHLFLPAAPAQTDSDAREPIGSETKPTILVVEDEDQVRNMAVRTLKSLGYQTLEADNGKTGLAVFKQHHQKIDAVLLDIIMPQMSGTEAFKKMLAIDPAVKVVIASGHITSQDQKKMFARASAYIDKPYQIMELDQALRAILQ